MSSARFRGAKGLRLGPAGRAALAAGACLACLACGDLPQPFSREGAVTNPLVAPDRRAGTRVVPVKGTPHGEAFAAAIARAFRTVEIAAQTGPGPSRGLTLVGRALTGPGASPNETRLRVLWRVLDANGGPAGIRDQEQTVDARAWRAGAPPLLRRLARDAVAKIAPLVADPREAPPNARRPIAVLDIKGAPGDGRVSLRRSLAFELGKQGFEVSQSVAPGAGAIVLSGIVKATAAPDNGDGAAERVEIAWTVLGPGGRVLGTVKQANTVKAGSLDRTWGVSAVFAARAAAPGIAKIIRRAVSEDGP